MTIGSQVSMISGKALLATSLPQAVPVAKRHRLQQAVRRLTLLASAESLGDLAALPGNRLESVRGDREGQCSIRISAQGRIRFRLESNGPCDGEIVVYHH